MTRRPRFDPVAALAWMILLYLTLPILIVFPVSVTNSRTLELPRSGISMQHWGRLFSDSTWLAGGAQSLLIASAASLISVSAGTLCAIGCWRLASRTTDSVRMLMLLPIVVPSIVYAVGLYRYYAELRLLGSYVGVIAAHAVLGLPYVMIAVSASLANFDQRLEQAARNLGASTRQTIMRVIVPNILPGILSGAIFAFVHSWDELVVVLFIASRAIHTLPRMMWDGINENLDPRIAVVATAMVVFSVLLLLVEYAINQRPALRRTDAA